MKSYAMIHSVLNKLIQLRFALRSWLSSKPALYFTLQQMRPKRRHLVVTRKTEIVIEGYPRSGNTFAVAAFLLAQGRPVKIAHHLHVPAQVILAAKWGIPTIVLIRNPEEAILSRLIRNPHISIDFAIEEYLLFYRSLKGLKDQFVLATFDEVTKDFGSVIKRVNEHFGCSFAIFEHTPNYVEEVFKLVEEMDKKDNKGVLNERTVARPSPVREKLTAEFKKELRNYSSKLVQAKDLYQTMTTGT
jgi:hypothetical protein